MSNYYRRARLYPTILTAIPMLWCYSLYIHPLLSPHLEGIWDYLPILGDTVIFGAFIWLMVQINRFLSKKIFQQIFYQDELYMPTTNYLMPDSTHFDIKSKMDYYNSVKSHFDIDLLNDFEQIDNERERRKRIMNVSALIREKLRGNKMLYRHNVEYGFFRNLVGGAVPAFIFSLTLVALNYSDTTIRYGSMFLSIVYLIIILCSKILITHYGNDYAKIFYYEFNALNNGKES